MVKNTFKLLSLTGLLSDLLICNSWASQDNGSYDERPQNIFCSSNPVKLHEGEPDQMTTNTKQQPVIVAKVIQGKLRVTINPETPEEKSARMEGIKRVKAQEEAAERFRAEEFDKYWHKRWGDPKEMEEREWRRHGRNNK